MFDPTSEESPETQLQKSLDVERDSEDLRVDAYELHLKGYSSSAIATRLGVSSQQVGHWIAKMRQEFRDSLTDQSGAELLSSLMEEYEFLKAFAFAQLQDICVEVSKDGEVTKKKPNHAAAARYLDIIARTVKDRADLLTKTGAIPKEPGQLNINIKGENKVEVVHKHSEERTEAQILKDIEERLKHARTIE